MSSNWLSDERARDRAEDVSWFFLRNGLRVCIALILAAAVVYAWRFALFGLVP